MFKFSSNTKQNHNCLPKVQLNYYTIYNMQAAAYNYMAVPRPTGLGFFNT
jgi:hypothetical protein